MLYRLLLCTLLWPLGAFAQTAQVDPLTLRTRDTHQNLTIAADPYISADRYNKVQFGKTSPYEAGIVAINVYFRNDRVNPSASRFPFPSSGSASGKRKAWDEMTSMLRPLVLSTDVLPPHTTTHGFLFFDVDHQFDAIQYSSVYIPDLVFMTDKKALLFFEVDLHAVSSN